MIQKHVANEMTGKTFFDKASLLAGDDLTEQIDRGVGQGVFIAVRGDMYSSRA